MIYYLEDDQNILNLVLYSLNSQDLDAKGFETPGEFWKAVDEELPDLILLDIMLPEEDGISILKKLRKKDETRRIPVLMITAKDSEYDAVLGLDSGADDYISKPFRVMELVSRVKANLRRVKKPDRGLRYQEIFLDPSRHEVFVDGKKVRLTLKEFELLEQMMRYPEIVFTREQLLENIWGYDYEGQTRTVDVHIRTLRKKLGDAGEYIGTVRGVGYKIGDKDAQENI